MKTYLSLFGLALALTLLIALLIGLIGWLNKWQTAVEFSDGFFIAGAIVVILGVLSMLGGFSRRASGPLLISQSAGDADQAARNRLMMRDLLQDYNMVILATIVGALLIAASILIYNLLG